MKIKLPEALAILLGACFMAALLDSGMRTGHKISGAELVGVLIAIMAGVMALLFNRRDS